MILTTLTILAPGLPPQLIAAASPAAARQAAIHAALRLRAAGVAGIISIQDTRRRPL
jgi:hypothetical protein